ncbi:MAG: septum formation initiator family protein [Actinobacteria bacterium]|nr:septum formation initiator family protein [Actinomycetota bacterium]
MRLLRRPGPVLAVLLFLLLGAAFLTQLVPYRQIIDSERQVEAARERLDGLREENEALQSDADALHTDAEIEKLAREKLGYVRPGETAYVVLDPPAPATEEERSEPDGSQRREEPGGTWVEWIWDFLTGADLES